MIQCAEKTAALQTYNPAGQDIGRESPFCVLNKIVSHIFTLLQSELLVQANLITKK